MAVLAVLLVMRAVADRDPVVIGMNFGEGQKGVTVAAVLDESGLKRRFDPRHLGQIDVTLELFSEFGLVIEFLYSGPAHDRDPGFLRVGRIDQHAPGH